MKKEKHNYPMLHLPKEDLTGFIKVKIPRLLDILEEFYEIEEWAELNFIGRIIFDPDIEYLWFETEEDAILFKLTWV